MRVNKLVAITLVLPVVVVLVVSVARSACDQVCDEVTYAAFHDGLGSAPDTTNCREWQTDGADALLSANTKCVDPIIGSDSVGGSSQAHPSIKRRERAWPQCAANGCYGEARELDNDEIEAHSPMGTAGGWGGWVKACYCKVSS